MQSNEECVEVLLRAGANPNLTNSLGQTPLHVAAKMENFSCVRALLKSNDINDHPNWINKADSSGNTVLHEMMSAYNQSHSEGNSATSSIASIIQFIVSLGGDITLENKTDLSPVTMCCDAHLKRFLYRVLAEYQTNKRPESNNRRRIKMNNLEANTSSRSSQILHVERNSTKQLDYTECEICSDNRVNVIMSPCGHSFCCKQCAPRVKKCLICKEVIKDQIVIPDSCYLCEEVSPSVQFLPCMHLICCEDCSKIPKKCPQCREPIRNKILYTEDHSRKNAVEKKTFVNGALDSLSNSVQDLTITKNRAKGSKNMDAALRALQGKYQELRERVMCPICMDNVLNMVFLCGHGVCQMCGDRSCVVSNHCPICRKPIERKILLYCQ